MANQKLTDLTELTALAPNDVIHVVDVSDTSQNAAGSSKKVKLANLGAAAPSRPQIVATRGTIPNGRYQNATNTRLECRKKVYLGRQDVNHLRLAFGGFYNTSAGEANLGNDVTYEAALELDTPATYQRAYTRGGTSTTVPDGTPILLSEPVGFDLAAGGSFWIRHSCSVSAANLYLPTNASAKASSDTDFASAAASSQVAATGAMTTPSGGAVQAGMLPFAVLGVPAAPMAAVLVLGDSIADGTGDSVDSAGNAGYIARGLASVGGYPVPYAKQTVSGDYLSKNTLDTSPRKRVLWPYATHLICELGHNDIAGGATLATIQGHLQGIWRAAKRTIGPYGKPLHVTQCTILPRTTSSNGWRAAADQTPYSGFASGGVRDQLNAWIATQVGQGLLDAMIDANPYVEDQANLNKWITTGAAAYPTVDGIHPSSALHILAAQAVNAWAQTITP